jgi:hypothetical protein
MVMLQRETCTIIITTNTAIGDMRDETTTNNNNDQFERGVLTDDTVWYESDQYNTKRIAFIIRRDAILSLVNNVFKFALANSSWLLHLCAWSSQTGIFVVIFAVISSAQRDIYLTTGGARPRHWMVM